MKRLICRLFGHVPIDRVWSSTTAVHGSYRTACWRCGRMYDQQVTKL